jgi:hypothetical protein
MSSSVSANTGELRTSTLAAAKQFKTSWIELGQYLFAIHKDKMYKAWGYLSFETYCAKELAFKQTTAAKLIKSYEFLEREEPRLADAAKVEGVPPASLPNYESVNILRLAKNNEKLTPQDIHSLRTSVLEKGRDPQEVRAQMKQILDQKDADQEPDVLKEQRKTAVIKRLTSALESARRDGLQDKLLPAFIVQQIEDLKHKLEDQLK